MKIAVIVVLYLAGWIGTWGALLAYVQGKWPNIAAKHYREDLAIACMFAIFPPMWLIAPFVTGFYEYGWMNPFAGNPHKKQKGGR